ncbi:unnamed protein product [Dracunculus medinensis]|uniref:Uncharacterized protein n=1 Tax=Dracunculus medinensis TaxID=318479 RepID=A0A158Q6A0_DRAME|nr:unnamed protein product [Dracunculus medinensis]
MLSFTMSFIFFGFALILTFGYWKLSLNEINILWAGIISLIISTLYLINIFLSVNYIGSKTADFHSDSPSKIIVIHENIDANDKVTKDEMDFEHSENSICESRTASDSTIPVHKRPIPFNPTIHLNSNHTDVKTVQDQPKDLEKGINRQYWQIENTARIQSEIDSASGEFDGNIDKGCTTSSNEELKQCYFTNISNKQPQQPIIIGQYSPPSLQNRKPSRLKYDLFRSTSRISPSSSPSRFNNRNNREENQKIEQINTNEQKSLQKQRRFTTKASELLNSRKRFSKIGDRNKIDKSSDEESTSGSIGSTNCYEINPKIDNARQSSIIATEKYLDSAHDTNKAPNERYTDRHHQSSPTFIKSNNFAPSDTYGRYVRRMQRYASVDTLNDNNVIADEYIRCPTSLSLESPSCPSYIPPIIVAIDSARESGIVRHYSPRLKSRKRIASGKRGNN